MLAITVVMQPSKDITFFYPTQTLSSKHLYSACIYYVFVIPLCHSHFSLKNLDYRLALFALNRVGIPPVPACAFRVWLFRQAESPLPKSRLYGINTIEIFTIILGFLNRTVGSCRYITRLILSIIPDDAQ